MRDNLQEHALEIPTNHHKSVFIYSEKESVVKSGKIRYKSHIDILKINKGVFIDEFSASEKMLQSDRMS